MSFAGDPRCIVGGEVIINYQRRPSRRKMQRNSRADPFGRVGDDGNFAGEAM